MKVRKKTLAKDHSSRLTSQHELAIAHEANGQIEEAVKQLNHVVKLKKQTMKENHPSRLVSKEAVISLQYDADQL